MVRWLIRAAVTATVVVILLTFVPLAGVVDALRRVSARTWAISLAILAAGHALNSVKLRLLLGTAAVPWATCLRAQFAALAANLGLPGLAGGNIVRAAYLVPAAGPTRVAVALVADGAIDITALVLMVAVALPVAGVPPALRAVMTSAGLWFAAAAAGVAALTLLIVARRARASMTAGLADAWNSVRAKGWTLARAFVISLVVQSSFVLTNVQLGGQAGVAVETAAWFVAWPLSKLVAVLPVSMGGLGVREAALVSLMAPYGAAREAVLASGLLWQASVVVAALGGLLVTQTLPTRVLSWDTAKSPAKDA